jgi:hypothetical protein
VERVNPLGSTVPDPTLSLLLQLRVQSPSRSGNPRKTGVSSSETRHLPCCAAPVESAQRRHPPAGQPRRACFWLMTCPAMRAVHDFKSARHQRSHAGRWHPRPAGPKRPSHRDARRFDAQRSGEAERIGHNIAGLMNATGHTRSNPSDILAESRECVDRCAASQIRVSADRSDGTTRIRSETAASASIIPW